MNKRNDNESMFIIQHDTTHNSALVTRAILENMKPSWNAVPLVECLGHSMDDAYQFPDEEKYHDNNRIGHGGCVVSGPGSCITTKPFSDKHSCFAAVSEYRTELASCHREADKLDMQARAHCLHGEKMTNDLEEFCNKCQTNVDRRACNSHEIIHKDNHPEIYSTSSAKGHGYTRTSGASSISPSSLLTIVKTLVKHVIVW